MNRCSFICSDEIKQRVDALCEQQRKEAGLSYGLTVAALVLIGIKTVQKSGSIYPSVVREVRNV